MRLLHPRTIRIIAKECSDSDFENATSSRKQIISHAWSEVFKFLAQEKSHPKMFIDDELILGRYLQHIYKLNVLVGCKLDGTLVFQYDDLVEGFCHDSVLLEENLFEYFDDAYLFSDATSLYFKGVNIFPYIFGDEWRKYVPVENLKEIRRQITKTLERR